MDRQKFAFDKTNFILLAIGMAVIIVGFLLMTGPSSTEGYFEPDIFSVVEAGHRNHKPFFDVIIYTDICKIHFTG